MRQFWVAVPGRVEHPELRVRALHGIGNGLVLTDCFNALNTVNRTAVLGEDANGVLALTSFVPTCYGARRVDMLFRMESK